MILIASQGLSCAPNPLPSPFTTAEAIKHFCYRPLLLYVEKVAWLYNAVAIIFPVEWNREENATSLDKQREKGNAPRNQIKYLSPQMLPWTFKKKRESFSHFPPLSIISSSSFFLNPSVFLPEMPHIHKLFPKPWPLPLPLQKEKSQFIG